MANLEYSSGPPSFVDGYVPHLTPESFNPSTATEEREIVQATIRGVQARKQKEALESQFNLELQEAGGR